jgi:hypothetical protein
VEADIDPGAVTAHPERSIERRLQQLELAVFGDVRQRIPGLINLMPELADRLKTVADDVRELKDKRQFWVQLAVQGATLLTAIAALIAALK